MIFSRQSWVMSLSGGVKVRLKSGTGGELVASLVIVWTGDGHRHRRVWALE